MDLITPDFGLIFWQVITLLVVMFVLSRVAWTPILTAIEEREQSVAEAIEIAEMAKKEMAGIKEDAKEIIRQSALERERILKEAVEARHRMLEKATTDSQRRGAEAIAKAKEVIEERRLLALEELRKEAVNMAIDMAEDILQERLKEVDEQKRLLQNLVQAPSTPRS